MNPEFILIAESGVLERQSLLLCESLRAFGGRYAQAQITILQPRRERPVSDSGRLRFEELRARIVGMSISSPCPEYGTSYRVLACGEYESSSRADCLIFMDSDAVILSEPDFELLDADVAVRPVDVKGMCTSGADDPMEAYWRDLCMVCNVDIRGIPYVTSTVDRIRVRASYNGGLTVVKASAGLFKKTADFFLKSMEAHLIPWPGREDSFPAGHGTVNKEGGRLWGSSQACLSLAVTALGLRARILPPSQNFPLHLYSGLRPEIEKGNVPPISHVHYHHVFRDHPHDNPIVTNQPGFPPGSMQWLIERTMKFA